MLICENEYTLGSYFFDELRGRFLTANFNGGVDSYEHLEGDQYKPTDIWWKTR